MTRPLRLEIPGALYHVTSRGVRKTPIYRDNADRFAWLDAMAEVASRFNFVPHAFCQMTNHYHLLVATVEPNLCAGMRHLNGIYSQQFNKRHGLVGHVFQGRYDSVLVQRELYLLELTRYIVLNPLRAQMVTDLNDWRWSSHRFMIGTAKSPSWLDSDTLLTQFGDSRPEATDAYLKFVMAGRGLPSPLRNVKHRLLLGDDEFVAKYRQTCAPDSIKAVTREQRRVFALSLDEYVERHPIRGQAMAHAYFSTAYTMKEIGRHFGVSYKVVSRAVQSFEDRKAYEQNA